MRVVVTGATGNVGTSVLARLARDPMIEVLGLARRAPKPAAGVPTVVACDVTKDDLVAQFRGADAVVHLAWFFQPTHRPQVTWNNNVVGSERVFRAAADAAVPTLVHASSVGVYSPGVGRIVDESWPTHSTAAAAYGREKAYVERLLDRFEAEHPETRTVRLRPCFLFKRAAASEQRRIFAGPLLPNVVARGVPVLPYPAGLRFQALQTDDAAEAYYLAVTSEARGAFNLATSPAIDGPTLAPLLGARLVSLPPALLRVAVAAGWHARMIPADPTLFDLVRSLPLLDSTRAHTELGWRPTRTGIDAITELLEGIASGSGAQTAPLHPDGIRARLREVASTSGSR